MMLEQQQLAEIIEAILLTADQPQSVDRLLELLAEEGVERQQVKDVLSLLATQCEGRGYELKQVASGYRFQVRQHLSPWVGRLFAEKPPRYSRALLETLALIAYRQPVTRGDIEDVRGVAVSSSIIRTLLEREWIRVVGYKEVPGRPAMYGTTKAFLDYFNLKGLDELPPMAEVRALAEPHVEDLMQAGPEYAEGLSEDELAVAAEDDADLNPAATLDAGVASEDDLSAMADADRVADSGAADTDDAHDAHDANGERVHG